LVLMGTGTIVVRVVTSRMRRFWTIFFLRFFFLGGCGIRKSSFLGRINGRVFIRIIRFSTGIFFERLF